MESITSLLINNFQEFSLEDVKYSVGLLYASCDLSCFSVFIVQDQFNKKIIFLLVVKLQLPFIATF